jgi:two-component system sensor histidine kinase/response regulator
MTPEIEFTPNILIVDDIPANLIILSNTLNNAGYRVFTASRGKEALLLAEKEKPDLILLDIMMPDMDGFEVCRKLKQNEKLKDIPVIFISALNDTNDIVKGLSVGGADYITKPFQNEEVKARVATHIKISLQNNKLKEQSIELQKLNTDKDRFISILAHDLKNPFIAILGFSEILAQNINQYDKESIESYVEMINFSAKRFYNFLEELLVWAKAQSGKFPFEPKVLKFNTICSNVLDVLSLNSKNKNIAISAVTNAELEIFADVDMLKTILRNLISNAIKFTEEGGTVTVEAIQINTNIIISVSDTGIGIPPETTSKLFDISKIHTTTGTANETGTGLGLILCKEFTEKHGGYIWVESEIGKGSKFSFSLPLPIISKV